MNSLHRQHDVSRIVSMQICGTVTTLADNRTELSTDGVMVRMTIYSHVNLVITGCSQEKAGRGRILLDVYKELLCVLTEYL